MDSLTLPGTIPGLLRRGSPVVGRGIAAPGVVVGFVAHDARIAWSHASGTATVGRQGIEDVELSLTDATGRAHAAVWFKSQDSTGHTSLWDMAGMRMALGGDNTITLGRMCDASNLAHEFEPMTDAQIAVLRDMVLALAEVLHG